jgi:hypothetical protein
MDHRGVLPQLLRAVGEGLERRQRDGAFMIRRHRPPELEQRQLPRGDVPALPRDGCDPARLIFDRLCCEPGGGGGAFDCEIRWDGEPEPGERLRRLVR